MNSTFALSMKGIHFSYGLKPLFTDFSLDIQAGKSYCLIGASGCGKTTALELMNGLLVPQKGEVFIDGHRFDFESSEKWRRSMGYVIQGSGLFPHMTLLENLSIIAQKEGWEQKKIQKRTHELLELLALPNTKEFLQKKPREISGGQQQRVGIARALFLNPSVLLMDEPFSALDPITRQELQKEFLNLRSLLGLTIVMVTHDLPEAFAMSDEMILLNNGKIEQKSRPSEFLLSPHTEYVNHFMESHSPATLLKGIALYSVLNSNIYLAQKDGLQINLIHLETGVSESFSDQSSAICFLKAFGQFSFFWVDNDLNFLGSQNVDMISQDMNPFYLHAEEHILDGMKALLREKQKALPVVNKKNRIMGVFSEGALNAL